MPSRVDKITLTLYVYDEFAGHREVTFDVDPTQEPAFLEAVMKQWRDWTHRLLSRIRADGGAGGIG